jgi:hypothetical protein
MMIFMSTKSVFVETFGESPLIKVMDFFLMYPDFDYSKSQVAKETGISRITIEKIWSELIKKEIIIKTRESGNAALYKLNTKNPKVKILMKLDFELSSATIEQENPSKHNSAAGTFFQKIGIPA